MCILPDKVRRSKPLLQARQCKSPSVTRQELASLFSMWLILAHEGCYGSPPESSPPEQLELYRPIEKDQVYILCWEFPQSERVLFACKFRTRWSCLRWVEKMSDLSSLLSECCHSQDPYWRDAQVEEHLYILSVLQQTVFQQDQLLSTRLRWPLDGGGLGVDRVQRLSRLLPRYRRSQEAHETRSSAR